MLDKFQDLQYPEGSSQNFMNFNNNQKLLHQTEYAKFLRPLLPAEAFTPDPSKLIILLINLAILIMGWAIASQLDRWSPYLLWLYFPLAVVMGNSIFVLGISSHNIMHGSVIRNSRLMHLISLLGLTMQWMPPTLWQAVHNRAHHSKTNSLTDPDRNYLYEQPQTWGKRIQNLLLPSSEVNPIGLIVGMMTVWGLYTFRHLTSVLLFNGKSVDYVPATFTLSTKKRLAIAGELFAMVMIHSIIIAFLQFSPLKLVFGYFLPISIGYAISIFYIYTNHLLCQMTSVNDPLLNSVSIRVPKIFDRLHLNFSYHTEHHIFPAMNSDYYPQLQELIKIHYPERLNLLDAREAWSLLMQTPRHYKNQTTFTDWSGEKSVSCPLVKKLII